MRTVEAENFSLEQVVTRLKIDLKVATTAASQADQARMETAEKLKKTIRTQEEFNRQLQQIREINLLRESNVTLRSVLHLQACKRAHALCWTLLTQACSASI